MSDKNHIHAFFQKGTRLEGYFSFSGASHLAGELKGKIYSDSTVIIAETAVIEADIEAREVYIHGLMKGNILASDRVEIKKPARFEGVISSPSLSVEEGVIFHGKTDTSESP